MADEPTTPAVESETPEVTEEVTPTQVRDSAETPETPAEPDPTPESKDEPTVAGLQALLAASEAKLAKSVRAEQTLRARAQTAETELTGFKTAAQEAEAERVANLSLAEQLAEERKKREAAESSASSVQAQWTEYRIESELSSAGFLQGLEGDAKAAQLQTLTGLPLVQDEGNFSITLFSQRFGGMKPEATKAPTQPETPPVVDLGGKTPAPSEPKAERKQQLLAQLTTAEKKGDRAASISIRRELHKLNQK